MNKVREHPPEFEEDVTDQRPTILETLQMRVWDLRCWIWRIGRNLFWSREALARREEAMQREQLEILLSAYGHTLTDEERAHIEKIFKRDDEVAGKPADSE